MAASKKAEPKKAAAPKVELPPDVIKSDTEYPTHDERPDTNVPEDIRYQGLTFYKTKSLGWVLCTLNISSGRRRYGPSTTARNYGITMDGKVCRVGSGPHVLATVKVYLTKANIERLGKYITLWVTGMSLAGETRDRISTRRAQGQVHRAAGRTSWMW